MGETSDRTSLKTSTNVLPFGVEEEGVNGKDDDDDDDEGLEVEVEEEDDDDDETE